MISKFSKIFKNFSFHKISKLKKRNQKFKINKIKILKFSQGRGDKKLAIPEYTVYKYFIIPKNIRLIVE
jgi:hypothetical protein